MKTTSVKIISGGQTGVDTIGLEVAKEFNISTGGMMPKHYRREDGLASKEFIDMYSMIESIYFRYSHRTRMNVLMSDITVLFGDTNSAGSRETILFCVELNKPYLLNPNHQELFLHTSFLLNDTVFVKNYVTINIAGNRASKLSKRHENYCRNTLRDFFNLLEI